MDGRGSAPVLKWIKGLDVKAQVNCRIKIERLQEFGHKLERPDSAYLGEKIYELRVASDQNQYRILYFFHGRKAVVLGHSFLKKTRKVPKQEIQTVIKRKEKFETSPTDYTYKGPTNG